MLDSQFIHLWRGCELGNGIMLAASSPFKLNAFALVFKFLRNPR